MKNAQLIYVIFALSFSTGVLAQGKDSVKAKQIIEKGTKGDSLLGKEIKKKQLTAPPLLLHSKDSVQKKQTNLQNRKKKNRQKRCKSST